MRHWIYAIQNCLNGKIYIGQTKHPNRRWDQHKYDCFVKNETYAYLYNAMRKYGVENFTFTVLKDYDKREIDAAETQWIFDCNSHDRRWGYNLQLGGQSNKVITAETRKKIGEANKGRVLSAETRQKIRSKKLGKQATPEARAKMSESRLGVKLTEEHRKAISRGHIGISIPHTPETKSKMSEQRRGEKNVRAKLTEQDVLHILRLFDEGYSNKQIAEQYGVKKNAVWRIRTGKSWIHITRR